jgi:xanthine/CO dehydrogenase XdhC/CoxF family maturation factor
VQGSTYRRAGARLLLTSAGRRIGSVSGGCLEADLVRKAWWLTTDGKCPIRRYDTSVEGEIAQEFGLGCNGVIDVLLERLEHSAVSALSVAQPVRRSRKPAVIATVIAAPGLSALATGQRWIRFPDGETETNIADPQLIAFLDAHFDSPFGDRTTHISWQSVDLFIETVFPCLRLYIVGAGDDAIPMTRQARLMGYETFVVDGRSHLARKERFPEAAHVEAIAPEEFLRTAVLDDWTAVVLMSHSYAQDLAALSALAQRNKIPYIGALGPRKRTEKMLSELAGVPE